MKRWPGTGAPWEFLHSAASSGPGDVPLDSPASSDAIFAFAPSCSPIPGLEKKKKKKELVHAASGTLLEADVLVGGVDADAKPEDQMEREGEEAEDRGASSNDE